MELEKKLGGELEVDIKLDGHEAVLTISHEGKMGSVSLVARINAVSLVDKITDMIPGEWDDKLLDGLAEKMLSKKS